MIDSYTIININKLKRLYMGIHSKQGKELLYISAASPIKRKKCGKNERICVVYC